MVLRRRWRAAAAMGAVVAVVSVTAPVRGSSQTVRRRFTTLGQAIDAGVLDGAVLAQLRSTGSTDPLVQLSTSASGRAMSLAAASPVPVHTPQEHKPSAQASPSAEPPAEITTPDADIAAASLDAARDAIAAVTSAGVGATELRRFGPIPAAHYSIRSEAALLRLVNATDVAAVRVNERLQRSLASSLPFIGQPTAAANGLTGAGTYVGVLDTGANYAVSDLGSCTSPGVPAGCRVADMQDFAPNDGVLDDDGHGTNVSSIVARTAPGTTLFVGDVFNGASASTSDIITAEQWLITKRNAGFNVVAVNLSLGGSARYTSNCTDTFQFSTLLSFGIQPVVAAGNGVTTPVVDGIASPACIAGAISVGAVYDSNIGGVSYGAQCADATTASDKITCFSQSSPLLTLLAPGAQVTAGGITEYGTSQATPHVAGSVAIARACRPDVSHAQVISALQNTGVSVADARFGGRVTKRIALANLASGFPAFSNDDRATPTSLALSGTTAFNTCSATAQGGEPAHAGSPAAHSLWYRISSASRVSIDAAYPGAARVAVYRGASTTPEPATACAGGGSCNHYRLDPGTFDIAVDSSTVANGSLVLSSTSYGLGADARANASVITEGGAAVASSNADATVEGGETTPSGSTPTSTVWYRLSTGSLGRATISLSTSTGAKRVAVYDAGTTTLRAQSIAGTNVNAGPFAMNGSYDIQVSGDDGPFTLSWTIDHATTGAPSNDGAGSPIDLVPASGGIDTSRSNAFATADGGGTKSVWYRWTAPVSGIAAFSTRGSNFETSLRLYSDAGVTLLDSSNDINPTDTGWSTINRNVIGGEVYWLAVGSLDGTDGTVQVDWTLTYRSSAPAIAPPSTAPRSGSPSVGTPGTIPRGGAPVAQIQP